MKKIFFLLLIDCSIANILIVYEKSGAIFTEEKFKELYSDSDINIEDEVIFNFYKYFSEKIKEIFIKMDEQSKMNYSIGDDINYENFIKNEYCIDHNSGDKNYRDRIKKDNFFELKMMVSNNEKNKKFLNDIAPIIDDFIKENKQSIIDIIKNKDKNKQKDPITMLFSSLFQDWGKDYSTITKDIQTSVNNFLVLKKKMVYIDQNNNTLYQLTGINNLKDDKNNTLYQLTGLNSFKDAEYKFSKQVNITDNLQKISSSLKRIFDKNPKKAVKKIHDKLKQQKIISFLELNDLDLLSYIDKILLENEKSNKDKIFIITKIIEINNEIINISDKLDLPHEKRKFIKINEKSLEFLKKNDDFVQIIEEYKKTIIPKAINKNSDTNQINTQEVINQNQDLLNSKFTENNNSSTSSEQIIKENILGQSDNEQSHTFNKQSSQTSMKDLMNQDSQNNQHPILQPSQNQPKTDSIDQHEQININQDSLNLMNQYSYNNQNPISQSSQNQQIKNPNPMDNINQDDFSINNTDLKRDSMKQPESIKNFKNNKNLWYIIISILVLLGLIVITASYLSKNKKDLSETKYDQDNFNINPSESEWIINNEPSN